MDNMRKIVWRAQGEARIATVISTGTRDEMLATLHYLRNGDNVARAAGGGRLVRVFTLEVM